MRQSFARSPLVATDRWPFMRALALQPQVHRQVLVAGHQLAVLEFVALNGDAPAGHSVSDKERRVRNSPENSGNYSPKTHPRNGTLASERKMCTPRMQSIDS